MIKANAELSHIAAKCCLNLGDWEEIMSSRNTQQFLPSAPITFPPFMNSLHSNIHSNVMPVHPVFPNFHMGVIVSGPMIIPTIHSQPIKYYTIACNFDPNWFKAWYKLATAYYNSSLCLSKDEVIASFIFFIFGALLLL